MMMVMMRIYFSTFNRERRKPLFVSWTHQSANSRGRLKDLGYMKRNQSEVHLINHAIAFDCWGLLLNVTSFQECTKTRERKKR